MLESPLIYFPVSRRPFKFRSGLRKLKSKASGDRNEFVLQLDSNWYDYRQAKLASRKECLDKYICEDDLSPQTASRVIAFLIKQLCHEHPKQFTLQRKSSHTLLHCTLSGETLLFDDQLSLVDTNQVSTDPPYRDALDALCCQIQEDFCISALNPDGSDTINYLHLCLPNYWATEDKIGRSFLTAHTPVPGMEKINSQAHKLINTLIHKGLFERFTWGLTTDTQLNHHPIPPPDKNQDEWYGRRFNPDQSALFLRIERQVTIGLPEVNAFIFTLRTYFRDIMTLTTEQRRQLAHAIATMPAEIRAYKGLANDHDIIIDWLTNAGGTLS